MIVIDYSGTIVAALFSQKLDRGASDSTVDEQLLRHMVLNTIRAHNVMFREKYGNTVYLACDSTSWRKSVFKQYKAARKKTRDDSPLDWDYVFSVFKQIRDELAENSPFKVLHVDNAEADDIIAVLVEQTQEFGQNEPVMIVSNDKDFLQLQKYSNVEQFSPMKNRVLKEPNPYAYLQEHILRGDAGDGVPNFLSDDDTFVTDKRQKPLSKKRVEQLLNCSNIKDELNEVEYRNWQRNRRMVELSSEMIPNEVVQSIEAKIADSNKTKTNSSRFLNYLIEKRCNQLVSSVSDFYPL